MYATVLGFAVLGVALGAALLAIGSRLGPGTGAPARPFEGGSEPTVHAWHRIHPRWLLFPLIFLLFDMEMAFMYPWAAVFRDEGWVAFAEMGMFIGVLLLGVLYAAREQALRWE